MVQTLVSFRELTCTLFCQTSPRAGDEFLLTQQLTSWRKFGIHLSFWEKWFIDALVLRLVLFCLLRSEFKTFLMHKNRNKGQKNLFVHEFRNFWSRTVSRLSAKFLKMQREVFHICLTIFNSISSVVCTRLL